MSLGMMNTAATDRFDALCRAVAERGKGLTLTQIGDAAALAQELEKWDPDVEKVELLLDRLGLDEKAVAPTDAEAHAT